MRHCFLLPTTPPAERGKIAHGLPFGQSVPIGPTGYVHAPGLKIHLSVLIISLYRARSIYSKVSTIKVLTR